MRREYAKTLTRDYLEYLGVTNVTEDARVFSGEKELKPVIPKNGKGYWNIQFYDPAIRQATPPELRTSSTGEFPLGLHRIVYVWYNRIQPHGMVVDHIDECKTNNHLSNLQLTTSRENILKSRVARGLDINRQMKCKLNKPRSFYEDKLSKYTVLYEKAKEEGNATEAHKQRSNVSNARAKLNYYDAHLDEALQLQQGIETNELIRASKDARSANIAQLKALASKAKARGHKRQWHQLLSVVKNYDAFTPEQMETIIKSNEERYNEQ